MYDFYSEHNPGTTFHLCGKWVPFRGGYFSTGDKELAEAMLLKQEEWQITPGEWNDKPAPVEMAVPYVAPRATVRKRKYDDSL
jgi:hypothetical protein